MSHQIRTVAAVLAASAVLLGSAAPASAGIDQGLGAMARTTPVFFVATSPLVLITRPTDIAKPFKVLVARPFTYTFVDALGEH